MTSFVSKLSAICVKKDLINAEDAPWFEYGIETRITTAACLIPFTLLAMKLSDIPTTLAFLATFKLLRARTSGYHANSTLECILVSLVMELFFLGVFLPHLSTIVFYISISVSFTIIFFLAPFAHPNMNFSKKEVCALRTCARRSVTLTTLFALLCYRFNFTTIAKGITTGTAMASFMLCLAYFIDWRKSI